MRSRINPLFDVLEEMIFLLKESDEPDWADALERQGRRLTEADEREAEEIARELLRLFAGAGSLSDLVLHRAGVADPEINNRFDHLRRNLLQALIPADPPIL